MLQSSLSLLPQLVHDRHGEAELAVDVEHEDAVPAVDVAAHVALNVSSERPDFLLTDSQRLAELLKVLLGLPS